MSKQLIDLVWFLFVVCMGLSATHIQADLVGYWKLDESSGTIAADAAGGDNDGQRPGHEATEPYVDLFREDAPGSIRSPLE